MAYGGGGGGIAMCMAVPCASSCPPTSIAPALPRPITWGRGAVAVGSLAPAVDSAPSGKYRKGAFSYLPTYLPTYLSQQMKMI